MDRKNIYIAILAAIVVIAVVAAAFTMTNDGAKRTDYTGEWTLDSCTVMSEDGTVSTDKTGFMNLSIDKVEGELFLAKFIDGDKNFVFTGSIEGNSLYAEFDMNGEYLVICGTFMNSDVLMFNATSIIAGDDEDAAVGTIGYVRNGAVFDAGTVADLKGNVYDDGKVRIMVDGVASEHTGKVTVTKQVGRCLLLSNLYNGDISRKALAIIYDGDGTSYNGMLVSINGDDPNVYGEIAISENTLISAKASVASSGKTLSVYELYGTGDLVCPDVSGKAWSLVAHQELYTDGTYVTHNDLLRITVTSQDGISVGGTMISNDGRESTFAGWIQKEADGTYVLTADSWVKGTDVYNNTIIIEFDGNMGSGKLFRYMGTQTSTMTGTVTMDNA